MVEFLVSFCIFLLFYLLHTLFLGHKKGRQHAKRRSLAHATLDIYSSRLRRKHNLRVLRTTTSPDALLSLINRKICTYTPVQTGPQSYPSRQAYLRRRLVIARQSYHALRLGLPSSILGYARYLHRRQR